MTGYYDITQTIKDQLLLDTFVNTVSEGDLDEVDIAKQTIFPLSHLRVVNAIHNGSVLSFTVELICMDIEDTTNDATTDVFIGNNNRHDILNTQLAVIMRVLEIFRRTDTKFILNGTPTIEPFTERFENCLTGWGVTFQIDIPNDMTVC